MILKSYIVEQNVNILENYQSTLMYGENNGIKTDIKFRLKNENKGAEIINFFEEEILKNKNILFENIINESLFNEKKIIFIHGATEKIFNEISECLEKENKNVKIYIFSDNLDKKSRLRNLFEKHKNFAIFACYQDNERTLINYINKELDGFKNVTGEIVNIILINSNCNREIVQDELLKIKNFFIEKNINKTDLLELLNIRSNTEFNEIRDTALIGNKQKISKLLTEVDILSEDSFFHLNSLNFRILKLIEIQKINATINDYEKALNSLKPPIFWKDKPIYLEQLKRWNLKKLNKISHKIADIEILMKKNSSIKNDIIIKNLIITLSDNHSIYF